jgi:hypothetical protein
MFESNDVEIEMDENDVSEEDILLYSSFPGPRLIVLNNAAMTNVLGLLLEESDDSFLVGIPGIAKQQEDGSMDIQPFVPVPYIRLLKSAIISVMYTFGVLEDAYMQYLDTKGRELYPEVAEYIEEDEAESESGAPEITSYVESNVSLTKDAQEGQQVIGMTDKELQKYLTDKYNNGELSSGSRKKH